MRADQALRAAMDRHSREYPNGDWKAANAEIGVARNVADSMLMRAGKMAPLEMIGNDECLKRLAPTTPSRDSDLRPATGKRLSV